MRWRGCGCLLVVLLLIPGLSLVLWAQTSADSAAGVEPQQERQLAQKHAQRLSAPVPAATFPRPIPNRPPLGSPGEFTFAQMARTAGTIFAGTVTRIERGPATGGTAVATVAITFRVERPLLEAIPGDSLTILEWLGLWSSGQRYRVGEHVLLFLYPPSKLGLTSSVGGSMGHFRLDPAGGILVSEAQRAVFQSDPLLAGRSHIAFNDFSHALRRAIGEQDME